MIVSTMPTTIMQIVFQMSGFNSNCFKRIEYLALKTLHCNIDALKINKTRVPRNTIPNIDQTVLHSKQVWLRVDGRFHS